jgi:prepilin-type N-terminal cleavage/methylation domain-containing protein
MTTNPLRRRAGFTMIEMMVMLVIFGITLAATVPNVTRYMRHDQVRMVAENFRAVVAVTQQRAMSTRVPHRIVYEPSANCYYIERRTAGVWVFACADTLRVSGDLFMAGGTDSDPSNQVLTFEPFGTVSVDDVPATIVFSNGHHDSSTVRIVRTGRTTLRHG